jgi:hypothetical protein
MDDFAHLLFGYILFRFLRLFGLKAGPNELAVSLAASLLPDILWSSGLLNYAAAHTATAYILLPLPLLFFKKTRPAAICFIFASTAHIIADTPMHQRTTVLFAPLLDFSITGAFDYWVEWQSILAYYLVLAALLAASIYLEKKQSGKITAML